MRLFVGISIPEDVVLCLRSVVDTLKPLADLRWSRVDELHLTTKFIGEQPVSRVCDVERALGTLGERAPFRVGIRCLGWFPTARDPRVFWAGVDPSAELTALARDTSRALVALGVPEEARPYAPHLTLARVAASARLEPLRHALQELASTDFGAVTVDAFTLYESRRSNDVQHYRALATFALTVR